MNIDERNKKQAEAKAMLGGNIAPIEPVPAEVIESVEPIREPMPEPAIGAEPAEPVLTEAKTTENYAPTKSFEKKEFEGDMLGLRDISNQAEAYYERIEASRQPTKTEIEYETAKFLNHLSERDDISADRKLELVKNWSDKVTAESNSVFYVNPYKDIGINMRSFHSRMKKMEEQSTIDRATENMNMVFEQVQQSVMENPETGLTVAQSFSKDYARVMEDAGISKEVINKRIKKFSDVIGDTAFAAIAERDLEGAKRFLESNKEAFNPIKYTTNLNKINKQIAKAELDQRKEKIAEVKSNIHSYPKDTIEALGQREDEIGEAARDMLKDYETEPLKPFEDQLQPLSLNPASIQERLQQVEDIEDTFNPGTEMPLFTSKNLTNIKKQIKAGTNIDRLIGFVAGLGENKTRLHKQLLESGNAELQSLSLAARVMDEDVELAQSLLRSRASSASSAFSSADLMEVAPFTGNEALNESIRQGIKDLGKLEDYGGEGVEDLVKKLANVHGVGDGWFAFSKYDLPLPRGVKPDQFERGVREVLEDPKLLKQVLNSEPLGGFEPMDFDDVELEAVDEGKYIIRQGNKVLSNADGQAVILDYNSNRSAIRGAREFTEVTKAMFD